MTKNIKKLKVALVAEELTQLGGAERVLDCFIELFPQAPVYTIVWDKVKTYHYYDKFDIRPSFIQKMPLGIKRYKWYLPLMPWAVESFDLSKFDLIISVTSALVKGVKTTKDQLHISYCNTPTRYLWIDSAAYLKNAPIPFFVRPLMPLIIAYLKRWDLKAAQRPDYFIANSKNVQKRIQKYYHRTSFPIFVPVDTEKFRPQKKEAKYYLLVSRIEPYKKVDLVIDAFRKNREPLLIVGSGTKLAEYQADLPKNIKILGRVADDELVKIYQEAKATIFPQEEDAGIVPLESMACGVPVISLARGGALETIINGKTGILFQKQQVGSLLKAVKEFKKINFDKRFIRDQAKKFDKTLFKREFLAYIKDKLKNKKS